MPRSPAPFARLTCMLLACAALVAVSGRADARRVRVRGGAALQAQARFVGGILELSGRLTDDAGTPMPQAYVGIATRGELALDDARACPTLGTPLRRQDGRVEMRTGVGGEFCLRWSVAPDRGKLALRFSGDAYHGAGRLDVTFDRAASQLLGTTTTFEPRPATIDLDKDTVRVSARLALARSSAHAERQGRALVLRLDGKEIGRTKTGGDGKAHFTVPRKRFAAPGRAQLAVAFLGDRLLAPSEQSVPVTKRASVTVALAADPGAAERGTPITLDVRATSAHGPVDGGVVEAVVGTSSLGTAPVDDGAASLVIELAAGDAGQVPVTVRYLPVTPWYRPGKPLVVDLVVAPPSPWLRGVLLAIVLAVGGWVAVSWRRSRTPPSMRPEALPLTPGVHVVESLRDARGYSGTVVDAHDGRPVPHATIVVRAPTLEGDGVLHRDRADAHGAFAFELERRPEGTEIVVEAPTHSAERKRLPGGGRLRIALLTRRRAVLRQFVRWARARGAPYDRRPEPTPAEVHAAAPPRGAIANWARGVEEAAFGPGPVTAEREASLREDEPKP